MFGKLILVPTPISDSNQLSIEAKMILEDAWHNRKDSSLFLIEDLKPARRRWIKFGLPREAIDEFRCYNEHNKFVEIESLIQSLKNGVDIY